MWAVEHNTKYKLHTYGLDTTRPERVHVQVLLDFFMGQSLCCVIVIFRICRNGSLKITERLCVEMLF